ncbi:hypothetical protein DL96DRAFT_1786160 [Flagelloscypha sp. PMI_526]|nr:hypothetical protein DL96DRAFT_1786160 [Flagelloscypha sp. PMI_526]
MSASPKADWERFGGYYRPIDDIRIPWHPSPLLSKTFTPVTPVVKSLPAHALQNPHKQGNVRKLMKRVFKYRIRQISQPSGPTRSNPVELDPAVWKASPSFQTPHPILTSTRQNYAYWTHPELNRVKVDNRNWMDLHNTPSEAECAFWALRSPGGDPHPEIWPSGLVHTGIPRRPVQWQGPVSPNEPLPFPWECQLNPFLQHRPYGRSAVAWQLNLDCQVLYYGDPDVSIPLSDRDLQQPATIPLLTHMFVKAVADDNESKRFPWPFMIKNTEGGFGITVRDVFDTIHRNFNSEYVFASEWESWSYNQKRRARAGYQARIDDLRESRRIEEPDSLLRVDYLGPYAQFRGLQPSPDGEGWLLCIGMA